MVFYPGPVAPPPPPSRSGTFSMGRRKIDIQPLSNGRARSMTFLKRRNGLFKKAYELGVLCSVEVAVIVFEHKPGRDTKVFEYCSGDPKRFLSKYAQFKGTRDIKRPSDFNGSSPDSDMDEAESEVEEGTGEGMDDVTVRDIPGPPPPPAGASSSAPWELFPRPPPRANYRVPEPSGDSETPIALADFFTRAPPPPLLPPPSPPPMSESSLPRGDFGLGGAMVKIFKSNELPEAPSYRLSAGYPPLPSNAHPPHPRTDLTPRESTTSSGVTRWRPGGNPASFDVGVHSDPSQPGYRPPSPDSLALWGDPARVVTGVSRKDYEVKDLFE